MESRNIINKEKNLNLLGQIVKSNTDEELFPKAITQKKKNMKHQAQTSFKRKMRSEEL